MWVVAIWHYIYQLSSPKKRLVDLYQGEPKGMTTKKSLQITQVIVFYRCSVPAAHTNLIFRPIHLKHDLHLFMEVMLFHITVASLPPFSNQSNIEPPPQNHWFGKIWWNERMMKITLHHYSISIESNMWLKLLTWVQTLERAPLSAIVLWVQQRQADSYRDN